MKRSGRSIVVALTLIALTAWGSGMAAAAGGKQKEEPGTLATHPLGALTVEELRLMVDAKPADLAGLREAVVQQAVFDYGIAEAVRGGLEKDPAYQEKYGSKRNKLLGEHFYNKEIYEASRPTAAEIEAAMKGVVAQPQVFQIVTPTREEAEAARGRVLAGEPFQKVAQQVSIGLAAGYGGMIGYLLPNSGYYTPQEEDVIRSLGANQVSVVCPGPLGFSVFWVKQISTVEDQKKTMAPAIEKKIFDERVQKREKETLDRLRAKAKIIVHNDVLLHPPTGETAHPPVLAEVDGDYIMAGTFFQEQGKEHVRGISMGLTDRNRKLTFAINSLLYSNEALRLGLDRDPEMKKPLEKIRRECLWDVWLNQQGRKMKDRPKEMGGLVESLKEKVKVREEELPEVLKQW